MMDCDAVREAMLDAEPAELRAEGDSPLASHLRGCEECRSRAGALLGSTAALARALDAGVAARFVAPFVPSPSRVGRRRVLRVALPLAAAAALAVVLVGRQALTRDDVAPYTPPLDVPRAPIVNTAGDGGVAVMSTADPSITVVWSF